MTRDDLGPHDRILNTETEWVGPDDPFTAEEQEEQCCATVITDECADDGRVEDYNAAPVDELDLEELKRQAEIRFGVDIVNVRVEDVGPKGPCGKKYTEWREALNCCDGVEEIVLNEELSATIVSQSGHCDVYVSGGRGPYSWKVRGYGFYGDAGYTMRDVETIKGGLRIHAAADACGLCPVEVTDGCSTLQFAVRSTEGRWQGVGSVTLCDVEGELLAAGYRECSRYVGDVAGERTNDMYMDQGYILHNDYSHGEHDSDIGNVGPFTFRRVSYQCGVWSGPEGSPDLVDVSVPGFSLGKVPMLKKVGGGLSCSGADWPDGKAPVIYNNIWDAVGVFKWVC